MRTAHRIGSRTSRSRRRTVARPERDGRRSARARDQGAALADPARQGDARPGARRPRDDDRARLLRAATRTATPYRNRGWWFPGALLPDFTNPGCARAGGRRSAATSSRSSESTASRPTAASMRGAPTSRYADGTHGGETNNRYPVLYGEAYHALMRSTGVTPVTFSRAGFTGSAGVSVPLGRRRGLDLGGVPRFDLGRADRGACGIFFWGWDLAGFSGPVPDAGALPALDRDGGALPDHAVPLGVQPPPAAVTRPHAVERRRADRRSDGAFRCSGASSACASGSCPYLAEQGAR